MKIKKQLTNKERLAKYSLLAAGIIGTDQLNAQNIIYTDEVPDFSGVANSEYFLDLNNDGTNDFRIFQDQSVYTSYYSSYTYTYNVLKIEPLNPTNGVLGESGTFAYPFALDAGAAISNGAGTFNNNAASSNSSSLNWNSNGGYWIGVADKYLGLKFEFGGEIHYGWARLDVNAAGDVWTVKDYAYEADPDTEILAGDMTSAPVEAVGASAIVGADVDENSTGADLEVTFTASTDESTLSEYRIIAVENSSAATFDLASAEALTATAYVSVAPNASANYTELLTGITDSDGNAITIEVPYKLFVLGIADGTNATINVLSSSAATVTLNTTADIATSIVGSDIADNTNTETDLQVNFSAATNESSVQEYKVIAVKNSSAGLFNLATAQVLPVTASVSVTPNGGPYTVPFPVGKTDSEGDPIVNAQAYSIFILSIADGTNANLDNITQSASTVTLNSSIGLNENILEKVNVYSNGNEVIINTPSELMPNEISLTFVNIQGQVIQQLDITETITSIESNKLSTGVYFIKLIDKNGNIVSKKISL